MKRTTIMGGDWMLEMYPPPHIKDYWTYVVTYRGNLVTSGSQYASSRENAIALIRQRLTEQANGILDLLENGKEPL